MSLRRVIVGAVAALSLAACSGDSEGVGDASAEAGEPIDEADEIPTVADAVESDPAKVEPPPGGWSGIFGEDMVWCLGELGFEATVEDAGVSYRLVYDQTQREVVDAAEEACAAATGWGDADYFTDEALSVSYDDRVQQAECMRELGYEISEPPSREVFIEQSQQERIAVYEPSLDIPQSEKEAAQEACPRMPPWELLEEAGQ